jgi:hypothetical protein
MAYIEVTFDFVTVSIPMTQALITHNVATIVTFSCESNAEKEDVASIAIIRKSGHAIISTRLQYVYFIRDGVDVR